MLGLKLNHVSKRGPSNVTLKNLGKTVIYPTTQMLLADSDNQDFVMYTHMIVTWWVTYSGLNAEYASRKWLTILFANILRSVAPFSDMEK